MPVIFLSDAPTYNKAPSPAKIPSVKDYPFHHLTDDDQPVWVSRPLPDTLYLSVRLDPEHFASWYKPSDAHDYGRMIMHSLATGQAGAVTGHKYSPLLGCSTQLSVDFANLGQPVFFKLRMTPNDSAGPHTLTIQMNPTKMGQQGEYEFLDQLHEVTDKRLLVGRMLADARVTRLDVATDIVGIPIHEILVTTKKAAIEGAWKKTGGTWETNSLFTLKKTKDGKTGKGAHVATVYDKRAERISAGRVPPHDPAPVVRVEMVKSRFGNKPFFLSMLPKLPNILAGVRVGLVRSALKPASWTFLRYAQLRRAFSVEVAASLLNLTPTQVSSFEHALATHPSDIVDSAACWGHWQASLHANGVGLLIEAAVKKSAGVPLPDEDAV